MSTFPDVQLNAPFVAQQEYSADVVDVIQIDDNVANKRLAVFCQLGSDPSFKYWVVVMQGDSYTVNWTNDDIINAIKNFFNNN